MNSLLLLTNALTLPAVASLGEVTDFMTSESGVAYHLPKNLRHIHCSMANVPSSDLPSVIAASLRGSWKKNNKGEMDFEFDQPEKETLAAQYELGIERAPEELRPILKKVDVTPLSDIRKCWEIELKPPNLTPEESKVLATWMGEGSEMTLGKLWIVARLSLEGVALRVISVQSNKGSVEKEIAIPLETKFSKPEGAKLPQVSQPWTKWINSIDELDKYPWRLDPEVSPFVPVFEQLNTSFATAKRGYFVLWSPALAAAAPLSDEHPLETALKADDALRGYFKQVLPTFDVYGPTSLIPPRTLPRWDELRGILAQRNSRDLVAETVEKFGIGVADDDYEQINLAGANRFIPMPRKAWVSDRMPLSAWAKVPARTRTVLRSGVSVRLDQVDSAIVWLIQRSMLSSHGGKWNRFFDIAEPLTLGRSRCTITTREETEVRYTVDLKDDCPIAAIDMPLSLVGYNIWYTNQRVKFGHAELINRMTLTRTEYPALRVVLNYNSEEVGSFAVRQNYEGKSQKMKATELPAQELQDLRDYADRTKQ